MDSSTISTQASQAVPAVDLETSLAAEFQKSIKGMSWEELIAFSAANPQIVFTGSPYSPGDRFDTHTLYFPDGTRLYTMQWEQSHPEFSIDFDPIPPHLTVEEVYEEFEQYRKDWENRVATHLPF